METIGVRESSLLACLGFVDASVISINNMLPTPDLLPALHVQQLFPAALLASGINTCMLNSVAN